MRNSHILVFFILSVFHLSGIVLSLPWLIKLTKPALISVLTWWFWVKTTEFANCKTRNLFLGGLLFSIAGDIFLLHSGSSHFLLGLFCFLIAHIFYIATFNTFPNFNTGLAIRQPMYTVPNIVFLTTFLMFLIPHMAAALRFPVFIYSLMITLMVVSAINLWGRVASDATKTIIAGAILFLISDTILACEKFEIFLNGETVLRLSIMLTYLLGQYYLALGTIKALSSICLVK